MPLRHCAKLLPALVVLALVVPSAAFGQASRTWVSGVGDDANPCSRTAPCKTFAGAISKTAAKGEINCLDPGGFGGVTITKALTIKCQYTEGGVLVSGTNAIVVNAGTGDVVTLRGLDINGLGTGLDGVKVFQAKTVRVLDSEIYGFTQNGVELVSNGGVTTKLVADRNHVHDNTGNGFLAQGAGIDRVHLRNNQIDENGCAIAATSLGFSTASLATNCGTLGAGGGAVVAINAFNNDMADSQHQSVLSNGSNSTIRIGLNTISGSLGAALQSTNSGALLTFGNNTVTGNPGGNGATTGSAGGLTRRRAG